MMNDQIGVIPSNASLTEATLREAFRYFDQYLNNPRRIDEEHVWRWPQDWREGVYSEDVPIETTCGICGKKIQQEDKRTFDGVFCYHTSCYEDFVYIKPHHKEKEE